MPFRGPTLSRIRWLLLAGALLKPALAEGQTVRGVVTERNAAPALGAIVTLERISSPASSTEIRSVLVDERGSYHLSAPTGGLYRIVVRRVATRHFRSDTLRLAGGETRALDITLEPMRVDQRTGFMLDRVTITEATPCNTTGDEAVRIADLWDNARTALLSTSIAARDSLVRRRLIRYERRLDPGSLAIQNEDVHRFDASGGPSGGFFRSITGDSLSRAGYWHRLGAGSTRFHGPDENALLSDAFLTDHCFTLDETGRRGTGLIALGFEPAAHRRTGDAPPEIRGTVWLDSATSELRSLEFSWVTLPLGAQSRNLGGLVQFSRLVSGPWYVQRWFLRMPEGLPNDGYAILEEGGLVQAGSDSTGAPPARVAGVIQDGAGAPLAGATIAVAGTPIRTESDSLGRFVLGHVPSGLQVIAADHPRYGEFGVPAAEIDVLLDPGVTRDLTVVARPDAEIPSLLCGESIAKGQGTLRLVVLDGATRAPIPDLTVTLAERSARTSGRGYTVKQLTDKRGVVLFCGAPAEQLLEVTTAFDVRAVAFSLSLPQYGMKSRVLQLERR